MFSRVGPCLTSDLYNGVFYASEPYQYLAVEEHNFETIAIITFQIGQEVVGSAFSESSSYHRVNTNVQSTV